MTNAELAQALKDLRDFLIIAGYEESHATRYTMIARSIEKLPEPAEELRKIGKLREIPGVGPLVHQYIEEILDTGTCSKVKDWLPYAPWSVIEMVRVPGLGAKTAKKLYQEYQIKDLAELKQAAESGRLGEIKGLGPKLIEAILKTG